MNLLFTLVAFFILALIGISVLSPVVGDLRKGSEAYKLGFRSGDRIVAVGQSIHLSLE